MPTRFAKRLASALPFIRHLAPPLDAAVAWLTGARHTLTGLLTGLPVVHLTTTGARSGQPRTVILLGIPHGRDIVLIASRFGHARHPAWLYNLRASPQALLACNGQQPRPYVAREVQGAERTALWQKAVDLYPGYERYAHRAAPRKIPVLLLSPVENLG